MIYKTMAAIAVTATLAATPVHAKGLLGKIGDKVSQQIERAGSDALGKILDGQTPAGSPGATEDFQDYGAWQFRVDKLLIGPDGEWQAVISARNPKDWRQGMVASEIKAALITADGEALANWGDLYRADSTGNGAGLAKLTSTLWAEPGEAVRVRLRFTNSRGIKPVRMRLESTGATAQSRVFDLN